MTQTGKPLTQLITQLDGLLGQAFVFREWSIHTEAKQELLSWILSLAETPNASLGAFKIDQQRTAQEAEALKAHYGTRDGVKLYGEGGHWLLLRVSGTEPIVRIYWETTAATYSEAVALSRQVDAALRETLSGQFALGEADIHVRT
jgi:phosphomannomutase